jgi:hypothetical protein
VVRIPEGIYLVHCNSRLTSYLWARRSEWEANHVPQCGIKVNNEQNFATLFHTAHLACLSKAIIPVEISYTCKAKIIVRQRILDTG